MKPDVRSYGSPIGVVRSESPWMLFVGIWLTAGGAAAGFVGEVLDWREDLTAPPRPTTPQG